MTAPAGGAPTIGILGWGNVIEDFLEPSGLTLERYCNEFTGSWIFGWARALAYAGVRAEIVCVSRDAMATVRTVHRPTGTPLIILTNPYGRSAREVFRWKTEPSWPRKALAEIARELAPYAATPPLRLARAVRRGRWQAVLCQEYEYPRFDVCVVLGRVLRTPVFACFQGGRHQHGRLERALRRPATALSRGLVVGPDQEAARVRARYAYPRGSSRGSATRSIPSSGGRATVRPHGASSAWSPMTGSSPGTAASRCITRAWMSCSLPGAG